jgi:hypothetical protein
MWESVDLGGKSRVLTHWVVVRYIYVLAEGRVFATRMSFE